VLTHVVLIEATSISSSNIIPLLVLHPHPRIRIRVGMWEEIIFLCYWSLVVDKPYPLHQQLL
jgi:hypothetical protein